MNEIMQFFQNQTNGRPWEDLKNELIMDRSASGKEKEAQIGHMKGLVRNRDIVDFWVYRQAIEKIFPVEHYNLIAEVDGELLGSRYKASWYKFTVSAKPSAVPTGLEQPITCEIKINAPGSRTLTSDIDTSISAKLLSKGQSLKSDQKRDFISTAADRIKKDGDIEGRIANAVIDNFYTISEQEFTLTSSLHRDSNAYLAVDDSDYASFANNDTNNPMVMGERLFNHKEYERAFISYKKKKHLRELAASFFLIRSALSQGEWGTFKATIHSTLVEQLNDYLGQEKAEEYKELALEDVDAILVKTQELYEYSQNEVRIKQEKISKKKLEEALSDIQEAEANIKIAAMNQLYVELLEEAATCKGKIAGLRESNQDTLKEIAEFEQKLVEEQQARADLPETSSNRRTQENILSVEKEIANLQKAIDTKKDSMRDNLKSIGKRQDELHDNLIKAHLFANEAYTSRYAVTHVVKGMQEKRDITISEQTVVGSALQQIGFKLLHTKELHEKEKSEGEISYLTAKYGYRVFNLVFHDKAKISTNQKITGQEAVLNGGAVDVLAKNKQGNTQDVLHYFKSTTLRPNFHTVFVKEEYLLLNSEAEIAAIKKSDMTDSDKPAKALEKKQQRLAVLRASKIFSPDYIQQFGGDLEKTFFLSIAAKISCLAYVSQLERKQRLSGCTFKTPLLQPQSTLNPNIVQPSASNTIPAPESSGSVIASLHGAVSSTGRITNEAKGFSAQANASNLNAKGDIVNSAQAQGTTSPSTKPDERGTKLSPF